MPRRRGQLAASGNRNGEPATAPIDAGKRSTSGIGIIDGFDNPLLAQWSFANGATHHVADCSVDPFAEDDICQWANGYQSAIPAPDFIDYGPGLALAPVHKRLSPSTLSTSSSVSSISNGTTLSPVNTDFQSVVDGQSAVSTWSRGPSPLRQLAAQEYHGVADMQDLPVPPNSDTTTSGAVSATSTLQTTNNHVCSWGGCRTPGFRTRDGLNWHVKADHLVICPVPGCSEANFQSKKMLDSHLRVAHSHVDGESVTANDLKEKRVAQTVHAVLPGPPTSSQGEENISTPKQTLAWDAVNDPAMKMTLSIATSKRKCREQLKAVLEKRLKRTAVAGTPRSVGTPRSMNSPQDIVRSRTPRLLETASFPIIWEHAILPFLIEFIPKWCGPGHVISVTRGREHNARQICIMTKKKVSRARRIFIAVHVRDLLPSTYRQAATFWFSTGEVDRLNWARGLSQEMPDDICNPRNPFAYTSPCMGDSIGTKVDDPKGESTATLGPCLLINGGSYWLANFHPFLGPFQTRETIHVEHPSPRDRERCVEEGHDALTSDDRSFALGELLATSGVDLKTTRISHDPYWEENDKEPPLVVTDWTLISAQTKQANMLRKFPTTTPRLTKELPITQTSPIIPGASVVSTGRSSGYQRGQVCEIPAYVSGDYSGNGTGRATREWFIEEPYPYDRDDEWVRGGIGVEGDSGAAIIDVETHAIMGQLWGRNRYFGPGPRHTYFCPVEDILDDVQERCAQPTRPQLPQYRDEAERWIVYPACRPCFDLATYLDSRRSSRESLRSMLGHGSDGLSAAAGIFGGDDPDLTTEGISELATPKEQTYWVKHAGPDDIVSPTPLTFSSYHVPASPRVADLRSPYGSHVDVDDLYDAEYSAPDAATGKRAALPMVRSASQGRRHGVS